MTTLQNVINDVSDAASRELEAFRKEMEETRTLLIDLQRERYRDRTFLTMMHKDLMDMKMLLTQLATSSSTGGNGDDQICMPIGFYDHIFDNKPQDPMPPAGSGMDFSLNDVSNLVQSGSSDRNLNVRVVEETPFPAVCAPVDPKNVQKKMNDSFAATSHQSANKKVSADTTSFLRSARLKVMEAHKIQQQQQAAGAQTTTSTQQVVGAQATTAQQIVGVQVVSQEPMPWPTFKEDAKGDVVPPPHSSSTNSSPFPAFLHGSSSSF